MIRIQAARIQNVPTPQTAQPAEPAQVFTSTQVAKPMTRADFEALLAKKKELSNQLISAQGRREDVANSLENAQGTSRTGLEQRLQVLDNRLAQLETDIGVNGQALASAPAALVAEQAVDGGGGRDNNFDKLNSGQLTAISIVFTLAVMMPLAIASARTMLRRASRPAPSPQILESAARLERMEQAIDAVAVEMERVSEGQRFVTQLLAKRDATPALKEHIN